MNMRKYKALVLCTGVGVTTTILIQTHNTGTRTISQPTTDAGFLRKATIVAPLGVVCKQTHRSSPVGRVRRP